MSSSSAPVDMKTQRFNNYMCECNQTTISTFSGKYKGFDVYFLGKMKVQDTIIKTKLKRGTNGGISQLIYDEWKCMTCVNRTRELTSYISKTGSFLCSNTSDNKSDVHNNVELLTKENYNSKKQIDNCELKIMFNDLFGLTEGCDSRETYYHYSYKLDNKTIDNSDMIQLNNCFKKYMSILDKFFDKFANNDDLLESLGIIKSCIPQVEYGYKLSPGTEWLIKNIEYMNTLFDKDKEEKCYNYLSFLEKLEFLGNVMCNSSISKGSTDDDVNMLEHSQANNSILNLLKNANDESALISMMRKQLSPLNYQRRTAEPKMGNIAAAESKLGEFTNSIHTMDKLEKHIHCSKVTPKMNSKVNSSMGAFAAMKKASNSNSNASKYGGLSKRCGKTSETIEIKNVRELIAKIKDGSIYKLSINAVNLTSVYIADTTLDRDKIINDYLWSFLLNEVKGYRFRNNVEISHVNLIETSSHRNIVFIAKDARQKITSMPIRTNCCYPEFLDTSIRRECGSAFEKMNALTNINIPDTGDLAIGIGTSVTGVNNKLTDSINIIINDEYTVRTLTEY